MRETFRKIIRFVRYVLFFIFVLIVTLFMSRVINFIFVSEIKAFQHTLTEQREVAGGIEQTAITDRVIDINKDIATHKVLANMPILRYFYIQEFRDIELVK